MASLKDVLRGRRDSEATALVAAALQRLEESSWMAERELRELPEVRAILDSPDELRRECILDVAGRRYGYGCVRLLSVIACKRVELTSAAPSWSAWAGDRWMGGPPPHRPRFRVRLAGPGALIASVLSAASIRAVPLGLDRPGS